MCVSGYERDLGYLVYSCFTFVSVFGDAKGNVSNKKYRVISAIKVTTHNYFNSPPSVTKMGRLILSWKLPDLFLAKKPKIVTVLLN